MSDERKQVIDEIKKEVDEIKNIAVIRLILGVIKSYKKGGAA